jgi:LmbE family N-acetylglucosaminyl deacetylase
MLLILLAIISFPGFGQSKKLNVVVLGAHPDDADYKVGGTAILLAKAGHRVLFVSITNGQAGHQVLKGKELAEIRKKEAAEAAKRLGITYLVLDNPDGELTASLEVRRQIIKIIREWGADYVIGHRPNDYHPDHRNASVLMQDAAYLVIVPNIVPDVPPLKKNPVFLYMEDRFQKPQAFHPDICVDITSVYEQKIYAMSAHESQYFEWLPWTNGQLDEVPQGKEERLKWLVAGRKPAMSREKKDCLIKWLGKKKARNCTWAESFEICEYGRQPSDLEIRELLASF